MPKYDIPIRWESYKRISVEAENANDAISNAIEKFLSIADYTYLEDTVNVDLIILEEYKEESIDIDNSIQKGYNQYYDDPKDLNITFI